jgi:hypothetical protein
MTTMHAHTSRYRLQYLLDLLDLNYLGSHLQMQEHMDNFVPRITDMIRVLTCLLVAGMMYLISSS